MNQGKRGQAIYRQKYQFNDTFAWQTVTWLYDQVKIPQNQAAPVFSDNVSTEQIKVSKPNFGTLFNIRDNITQMWSDTKELWEVGVLARI